MRCPWALQRNVVSTILKSYIDKSEMKSYIDKSEVKSYKDESEVKSYKDKSEVQQVWLLKIRVSISRRYQLDILWPK